MYLIHLYEVSTFSSALKEMYITLIPKKDGDCCPGAHQVRPISVTSAVYRAKTETMSRILDGFLHPCQYGARAGRSLHHAVAKVTSRLEQGKRGTRHWSGVSIDICKCFDTLPTGASATILRMGGVDDTTAIRTQKVVASMRRRWRLPGSTLSALLPSDRGLPQGCSLSVMVANAYIALLVHHLMEKANGHLIVTAYCNDVHND